MHNIESYTVYNLYHTRENGVVVSAVSFVHFRLRQSLYCVAPLKFRTAKEARVEFRIAVYLGFLFHSRSTCV